MDERVRREFYATARHVTVILILVALGLLAMTVTGVIYAADDARQDAVEFLVTALILGIIALVCGYIGEHLTRK